VWQQSEGSQEVAEAVLRWKEKLPRFERTFRPKRAILRRGKYFDNLLTDSRGADEALYRSNVVAWLQWWLMQHGQMSPLADHWGALPTPEPASLSLALVAAAVPTVLVRRRQR
jgi:hypothetical protein